VWNKKTSFKRLSDFYKQQWTMLFEIANLGDLDKPLSPLILSNPEHKVTKHIIYLYTMESFIYPKLNEACREKDTSLIEFFGPIAAALGWIIHCANLKSETKLKGTRLLYRGIRLKENEVNLFQVNSTYNLTGYTSTSTFK